MTKPESPSNVRALALVCLAAGALSIYIAAVPPSPGVGAARSLADGGLAIAAGALCWALASRFTALTLHVAVSLFIGAVSLALSTATTPVGAALVISVLVWICIYVGIVCQPSQARLHAACLCIALAVGLLASDVPNPGSLVVPFAATFLVTIELLCRMSSRLRADAMTDPLTGLLNRKGFLDASQRAISMCRRAGETLTVAHIDLDGFKQVNDREGHRQGDRLLKLCADSWRRRIRAEDILARLGGDEFVLVLPGSDRAAADELLRRLQADSQAGWSYGIAELEPDDDIEACVARADVELYAAKAERKRRQRAVCPSRPRALSPVASLDTAA
jgi:diguanylate cyclase (GGDEF)-like protein